MKSLLILFFLFINQVCLSQEHQGSFSAVLGFGVVDVLGNNVSIFRNTSVHSFSVINDYSSINSGMYKTDGSKFLFEKWKNNGVIIVGKKKYLISNINFDIDKQVFMSRIGNDSIFVFNIDNIVKVLINNRLFKSIYNNSESRNKVYEISYSSDDFSILKEHQIRVMEGDPNPMVNRPNRKIIQKGKYFVYRNGVFTFLKLKKASLMLLFSDDDAKKLDAYVRSKRFSYKKSKDVDIMLSYMNKS